MASIPIPAPMLATPGGKPFSSPEWLYEIKFDGYRCLAQVSEYRVELRTKSGNVCTGWHPEVAEALANVPGGPHVINGEACVLDDIVRSDFNRLHEQAARKRSFSDCSSVTLCAFDLLIEKDAISWVCHSWSERRACSGCCWLLVYWACFSSEPLNLEGSWPSGERASTHQGCDPSSG